MDFIGPKTDGGLGLWSLGREPVWRYRVNMKSSCLAAALALLSPAFPAVGQLTEPKPMSQQKADLLNDIEGWRATQFARWPLLASRLEPRLDAIKAEVREARADAELAQPRKELEAWKDELLRRKYSTARAEGYTHESRAQYSAEHILQAELAANLHALLAQAAARRAFVQTQQRSQAAVFDGARRGNGEYADGAPSVSAPVDASDPARYSKVRQILISQGASSKVVDQAIKEAIRQHADPLMVLAVINQESGFKTTATSYRRDRQGRLILDAAGKPIPIARGLMQLTADKGVNLYDVQTNLRLGVAYLKQMWSQFVGAEMTAIAGVSDYVSHGVKSAVAAYNAGPGAVHRYSGVPPYRETQGYVKRVLAYYSTFQQYMNA